jgi:hypothetical protein
MSIGMPLDRAEIHQETHGSAPEHDALFDIGTKLCDSEL